MRHYRTKIFHLFAFISLITMSTLTMWVTTVLTIAPDEDLFKGFDFDAFLAELEKALEEIEDQPPVNEQKSTVLPSHQTPSVAHEKETITIESGAEDKKKDPASLFLDPITQTVTRKDKKIIEPTLASMNAYSTIMNEFIQSLTSVEQKVRSSSMLSPVFKEEFIAYASHIIVYITVAHEQIEHKKIYKKLFLTPPEGNKQLASDMKKLRNMILEAVKKIKKLDEELVIKPEEEEQEARIDVLQQLAGEAEKTSTLKNKQISPSAPPEPAKRLERKDKKKHKKSKIKESHHDAD